MEALQAATDHPAEGEGHPAGRAAAPAAAGQPHVASDLAKIGKDKPLSPVLLVGGDLTTGRPLQIADGYHRVCASYHTDENTDVPCRLVAPLAARPR